MDKVFSYSLVDNGSINSRKKYVDIFQKKTIKCYESDFSPKLKKFIENLIINFFEQLRYRKGAGLDMQMMINYGKYIYIHIKDRIKFGKTVMKI